MKKAALDQSAKRLNEVRVPYCPERYKEVKFFKERLERKKSASAQRGRSQEKKPPRNTSKEKAKPAPRKRFADGETVDLESEGVVDDREEPKRSRSRSPKRSRDRRDSRSSSKGDYSSYSENGE